MFKKLALTLAIFGCLALAVPAQKAQAWNSIGFGGLGLGYGFTNVGYGYHPYGLGFGGGFNRFYGGGYGYHPGIYRNTFTNVGYYGAGLGGFGGGWGGGFYGAGLGRFGYPYYSGIGYGW